MSASASAVSSPAKRARTAAPGSDLLGKVKVCIAEAVKIHDEGYPHAVTFKDADALKDVSITARGMIWEFGWAHGRSCAEYDESLVRFSRQLIDKIVERDTHCACAFGRLRALKAAGKPADEDTLHELLSFDALVQVTEKMLAAYRVLSTPPAGGPAEPTISSTLKDMIRTMENCQFVPIRMVYDLAREILTTQ